MKNEIYCYYPLFQQKNLRKSWFTAENDEKGDLKSNSSIKMVLEKDAKTYLR